MTKTTVFLAPAYISPNGLPDMRDAVSAAIKGSQVFADRDQAIAHGRKIGARWLVQITSDRLPELLASDGQSAESDWPKTAGANLAQVFQHDGDCDVLLQNIPKLAPLPTVHMEGSPVTVIVETNARVGAIEHHDVIDGDVKL